MESSSQNQPSEGSASHRRGAAVAPLPHSVSLSQGLWFRGGRENGFRGQQPGPTPRLADRDLSNAFSWLPYEAVRKGGWATVENHKKAQGIRGK